MNQKNIDICLKRAESSRKELTNFACKSGLDPRYVSDCLMNILVADRLTNALNKSNNKANIDFKISNCYVNEIKRAVVILWADGTKTKATCHESDVFDPITGFAVAFAKHYYGSSKSFREYATKNTSKNVVSRKKWIEERKNHDLTNSPSSVILGDTRIEMK